MTPKLAPFGVAILLAALVGCQKQPEKTAATTPPPPKPATVEVVKETERSRNFLAVSQHLELGGTLYGYMDIDGDVLKVATDLHDVLGQLKQTNPNPMLAAVANQDFAAIATTLGLTDVKAFGLSSVPDGTGFFRNRVFFYSPNQRHGLLLGLGGHPGAFTHLNLAPADTAFYAEAELDLPAVYRTIKDVVAKVAGEPASDQMEAVLKNAGQNVALSVLDLIYGLKGHSALVLRFDPERTMKLPGKAQVTLPAFSALICIDGVASVVEPSLAKLPMLKRTDDGALHVYELTQPSPVPELQPVLVADGGTLYFATTRAFLDECRKVGTGLAQTPEFQKALAAVGKEGNGLTYVHPRFFDALRRFQALNPSLPPQVKPAVAMIASRLPKIDRPMIALRSNLPDGILIRSYWDRSMKQDLALISVYNPVTIGMMSAIVIPAMQKARAGAQPPRRTPRPRPAPAPEQPQQPAPEPDHPQV